MNRYKIMCKEWTCDNITSNNHDELVEDHRYWERRMQKLVSDLLGYHLVMLDKMPIVTIRS